MVGIYQKVLRLTYANKCQEQHYGREAPDKQQCRGGQAEPFRLN